MAFTYFFRDRQNLEAAIDYALPCLRGRAFIHVWDAGCAHGPEPYTLAILLRERMSDYVFRNVHIHATDIDSSFAGQVTAGVFAEQEVQRVPPGILQKYFHPASVEGATAGLPSSAGDTDRVATGRVSIAHHRSVETRAAVVGSAHPTSTDQALAGCQCPPGFVEVVPELRAKITFSQHDLLSLRPVREGLSLIVCKNVLLHFDEAQRIQVLRMFHGALQAGGTLVMEHTQKLPDALAAFFQQAAPHVQVYRKVEPAFVEHQAETRRVGIAHHPSVETRAAVVGGAHPTSTLNFNSVSKNQDRTRRTKCLPR